MVVSGERADDDDEDGRMAVHALQQYKSDKQQTVWLISKFIVSVRYYLVLRG